MYTLIYFWLSWVAAVVVALRMSPPYLFPPLGSVESIVLLNYFISFLLFVAEAYH